MLCIDFLFYEYSHDIKNCFKMVHLLFFSFFLLFTECVNIDKGNKKVRDHAFKLIVKIHVQRERGGWGSYVPRFISVHDKAFLHLYRSLFDCLS